MKLNSSNTNSWAFELESKIFSIVKARTEKALLKEFPNARYTVTSLPKGDFTQYPTIFIHELPSDEVGNDLDNTTINALLYTMQIEVYTNTSQSDARQISAYIGNAFKQLHFEVTSMPEFSANGQTYYCSIMRVRRVIGSGDIL